MTPVSAADTLAQRHHEQPVAWIHRWSPGLMSLRIPRPASYHFLPGQFARIGIRTEEGELLWRAYSIVSAPGEDFLEFFLVILPTGQFSGRVGRFNLGSEVLLDPIAQGFLTLERFKRMTPVEDLWMFATGTGLAPYLSILRDAAVWSRFRHIVLALSLRERQDIAYDEEMQRLVDSGGTSGRATFAACRTLTRDHQQGSLSGRLPALIESGQLQAAASVPLEPATSRVMLCGNPEMVEAMRALLKGRGFRMHRRLEPGQIIVENYW